MKLFLLSLICMAAVVHGGRIRLFRRTNSELVTLLAPVGNDLAVALADKLDAVGVDYTMPITAVDPIKTWKAFEIIAATVTEKMVPAECGQAVAVHAVIGFVEHLVRNLVVEDMLLAGKEIGEIDHLHHLHHLKPGKASGESMESIESVEEMIARRKGGHGGGMGKKPSMVDVAAHMKEVVDFISAALQEKVMVFESAIGDIPMDGLFDEIQALISQELFLERPVVELFQMVAISIHKYMAPFATGQITCDLSAALPQIEAGIGAIVDFLQGGFEASVQSLALPAPIKVMVTRKLMKALPEVAEIVIGLTEATASEDFVSGFISFFKEDADELLHMAAINKVVEEVVMDGRLAAFVEKMVSEEKTAEVAKLILETTAVALGDLELTPAESEAVLKALVDLLTGNKMPDVMVPQSKWLDLLSTAVGTGVSVFSLFG